MKTLNCAFRCAVVVVGIRAPLSAVYEGSRRASLPLLLLRREDVVALVLAFEHSFRDQGAFPNGPKTRSD
jgi:hypothetical protein